MTNPEPCFACARPMRRNSFEAVTADAQTVFVGPDCFAKIKQAGEDGYQPPLGGPRLFPEDSLFECSHCAGLFTGAPAACYGPNYDSSDGLPTVLCADCAKGQAQADRIWDTAP